jgi:ribose transport system ATP-binding protein
MLEALGISKAFAGVQALSEVDLVVRPGEVVGLVGENGAGKSTLMRILAGAQLPGSGELRRDGQRIVLRSPRDAAAAGIGMVFQEQSLLGNLSVAENLFLGHEAEFLRAGLLDWRKLRRAARALLQKVQIDVDPATRTSELSFAARQMVELAKALALEDRTHRDLVILLDEPTSVLERADIDLLFSRVRALKHRASFVFVSHRLDEVLALSDRIYVMKDGKVAAEMPAARADVATLHRLMVGRELHSEYFREAEQKPFFSGAPVLEAENLAVARHYRDLDLKLHRGEVLGIAGVVGSGREEVVRTLFGFLPQTAGALKVDGKSVRLRRPSEAVALGIGYIPRERRVEGLALLLSVASNMTLANLSAVMHHGMISRTREKSLAREWVEKLSIRTPSIEALCLNLSGGNQQKVALAKWLTAKSRILVLDHPTRGLDVGAKEEVYRLVRALSAEGTAIVLTSDGKEKIAHRNAEALLGL